MENAGGDGFNEFLMDIPSFWCIICLVAEWDHTYHQKNIGGSKEVTCTVYPLSLLPLTWPLSRNTCMHATLDCEIIVTIYDYGLCSTYQWQRCVKIPATGLKISPQCSMAMALPPPPSPIAPRGGSVARRPLSQLVLQRLWMLLLVALPRSAVYSVLQLLERHTKPLLLRPPGAAAACVRRELPPSNAVAVSVCRVL